MSSSVTWCDRFFSLLIPFFFFFSIETHNLKRDPTIKPHEFYLKLWPCCLFVFTRVYLSYISDGERQTSEPLNFYVNIFTSMQTGASEHVAASNEYWKEKKNEKIETN